MAKAKTNHAFAQAVGCSPSMASRLRTGARLPSASLLSRICTAYRIDVRAAVRARDDGEFAELLQRRAFTA